MDNPFDKVYDGVVVDNQDPENLGRIRFMIPGLIEPESGWAEPIGVGGGAQRGTWDIPDIGDLVTIEFMMADPDRPKYHSGYWGKPDGKTEVPTVAQTLAPADVSKVKIYETAGFQVVIDDRPGGGIDSTPSLTITSKADGTQVELQPNGTVTVTAGTSILLGGPDAADPVVLGKEWLNMMSQLLTMLLTHTHPTNVGPSYPSIELTSGIPPIQNLQPLLSKLVFALK